MMDYDTALMKFSQSYKDRNSVEFPTIFRLCDFKNKKVLEIGPSEGYFVKEASKLTDDITTTETSVSLSFPDRSFDVVLSRWVIQGIDETEKAVKEMCRVAKNNVMIVLPSEEGDETKLLEIRFKDKFEHRRQRIIDIKSWMSECGLEVREERKLLKFLFPKLVEAVDIFSALSFDNKLTDKEKSELREFLSKRKAEGGIHLTQGASFICGYR